MSSSITVAEILKEKQTDLELTLLAGQKGLGRAVTVSEINRPGLALSGYLDYFPSERVQILGLGEQSYLSTISPAKREEILYKVFSFDKTIPCIVMTRRLNPHPEVIRVANKLKLPLLRSGLITAH